MNPKDFEGVYKWKFLVPSIYLINWSLIATGPIFFPYGYQIFCMCVIVYSVLKTLGLCLGTLVSLIKFKSSLNKLAVQICLLQLVKESKGSLEEKYFHGIVVPSYKEDQEVLLDTLRVLAMSQRAKSQFIVFLAMEAHEQNSDLKAKSIIEKCKQNFFHINFTQHTVRPGQAKGKSSNVSWCVEHMQQKLQPLMLDTNKIIITVIDADSWAPKQYFQMIQLQLQQNPNLKDLTLFSAPQIYTRNHLEVPVINRTFDTMHSLVQLANLVAVKFSFPLSNYSLSYNLVKRIGWWDTCADAIGEDFHTCQKCFWKVEDQTVRTVPIYIPFNQVSLSTGEGYCKDIAARFWQAERHTLGVSDVAYSCHMLFNTPFRFSNLWLTILVLQIFTMAAIIPWALLGLGLQYKLMTNTQIHYFPGWLIEVMLNAATVFTFISYIFYQWWRRVANRDVYGRENDAWWRVLEYPVFFSFALFGFSIPSFVMASFAVLCTVTEYRVAEKHIDKKKSIENKKSIQKKASLSKPKSFQKKNSLLKPKSLKSDDPFPKSNKIANESNLNQSQLTSIQKSSHQLLNHPSSQNTQLHFHHNQHDNHNDNHKTEQVQDRSQDKENGGRTQGESQQNQRERKVEDQGEDLGGSGGSDGDSED